MKPAEIPVDDPRPVPPPESLLEQCCGNACENCIADIYYAELRQYRSDLAEWEARQSQRIADQ